MNKLPFKTADVQGQSRLVLATGSIRIAHPEGLTDGRGFWSCAFDSSCAIVLLGGNWGWWK